MENYFQIIPQEMITSIAKSLDIKSLCNFIMCSKEFKQICDTNDIWKYHYLKTIQYKWKIKEDSVHTGGYFCNRQIYLYEFNRWTRQNVDEDDILVNKKYTVKFFQSPDNTIIKSCENPEIWSDKKYVKFIKSLGCVPFINTCPWYSYNKVGYIIKNGCMACQSISIKNANFVYKKPNDMNIIDWRKDIYEKWKAYNESVDLHQWCQDLTHYDIDTLDIPSSCRGFKNYKKVIIKKLLTRNKNSAILKKYKVGQIVEGTCKNIVPYGCFFDLDGEVDVLCHINEISYSRINHPNELFEIGQRFVKLKIIGIDKDTKRISVSCKQVKPDPFATKIDSYKEGQIVHNCVVERVMEYGAFVALEDSLQ